MANNFQVTTTVLVVDEDKDADVGELSDVEEEEFINKVTAILAHATIAVSLAFSSNLAVFV